MSPETTLLYSIKALSSCQNANFKEVNYSLDKMLKNYYIGVGLSASLASSQPKKGLHHGFVTITSPSKSCTYEVILAKDKRSRITEDFYLSALVMGFIIQFLDMKSEALEYMLEKSKLQGD